MQKIKWFTFVFVLIGFISITSIYSMNVDRVEPLQKHTAPMAVMDTLFESAKIGKFSQLGGLCDPMQENDGDTDCICAIDPLYEPHKCSERQKKEINAKTFVEYFQTAKTKGSPEVDADHAKIEFLFGPEAKVEETMNLVRRDGFWYLSSF
ncbi:MAG: hypothetical protein ABUK01_06870 [Leptospirales bacterium]